MGSTIHLPVFGEHAKIPAGDFSAWLGDAEASLRSGKGDAAVPCGVCTACCRASLFIHIQPEETQTLQRIRRALLFPAPGLPKGHVLLGYNEQGHCPMFVANQCSIYEYRPQTCRSYDCRVFTATGIRLDQPTQAEIARRVESWVFRYESEESREQHQIVKNAAAFLLKNGDLFPPGSLPTQPAQLAALAVRIYRLFAGTPAKRQDAISALPDAVIAHAILTAMNQPDA